LIHFNIGDVVVKRVHQVRPGITSKLSAKWKGRYKVIDKLSNGINYQIHPVDDRDHFKNKSQSEIVHGSQLKLVVSVQTVIDETAVNTTVSAAKEVPAKAMEVLATPSDTSPTPSITSQITAAPSPVPRVNDSETTAMHPDYRPNLPTRMAKRVCELPDDSVRRSSRANKGQRTRVDGFVDPSYIDFNDDVEMSDVRKSVEMDE
jgi:hypothetical protein